MSFDLQFCLKYSQNISPEQSFLWGVTSAVPQGGVRSFQYLWSAAVTILLRIRASCRHVLVYHMCDLGLQSMHVILRSSV